MSTLYDLEYQNIQAVETVTFKPRNPTEADVPSVKALQVSLSKEELLWVGSLGQERVIGGWTLWNSTMSGKKPKGGDQFEQSDGTDWTILQVARHKLGSQWRVIAYQEK